MKRVMLVVLGLGFLASCTAQQPSISAIQHDTISVQSSVQSFLSAQEEARRLKMVDDEARRGSTPSQLLKGVVTRSDGVRIGRDLIGPLAGLEPILAALCEPAIGLAHRNPAVEKI